MDIPTTIYRDYIKKFNLCDCESIRLDVLGGYIQNGRKKVSSKYEICSIVNSTLIIKCRCCSNIYLIDMLEEATLKTDSTEVFSAKKISLYEARELKWKLFKEVSSDNSDSISVGDNYLKFEKLDNYKKHIAFSIGTELFEPYED